MNEPSHRTNEHVAAAEQPKRRFQCITLPADSVVLNGVDFDAMSAELIRLRARADADCNRERAECWDKVWDRFRQIDPSLHQRATTGFGSVMSLIDELANRPALEKTP